jgi:hypothetical protein
VHRLNPTGECGPKTRRSHSAQLQRAGGPFARGGQLPLEFSSNLGLLAKWLRRQPRIHVQLILFEGVGSNPAEVGCFTFFGGQSFFIFFGEASHLPLAPPRSRYCTHPVQSASPFRNAIMRLIMRPVVGTMRWPCQVSCLSSDRLFLKAFQRVEGRAH